MNTILALIDLSDVSDRVLQHAEVFAQTFGSHVVLLNVIPPAPVVVDYAPVATSPEEFEAVRTRLQSLSESLAGHGISVSAETSQGAAVETILAWCQKHHPDFIIMGSHGHGALYNLIVGSVTAGVLKKTTCPVLVVPSSSSVA